MHHRTVGSVRPAIISIAGIVLSPGLSGCISVPVVEQAIHEKPVSIFEMGCSKPYELKQDCGGLFGVQRILRIDKFDVAAAATEGGDTVLLLDSHMFRHALLNPPLILNSPGKSRESNAIYFAVRGVLEKNGINILRAIPVRGMGDTEGYFLELSGNGYAVLKPYTNRMR
jgi:hypothetical protein